MSGRPIKRTLRGDRSPRVCSKNSPRPWRYVGVWIQPSMNSGRHSNAGFREPTDSGPSFRCGRGCTSLREASANAF